MKDLLNTLKPAVLLVCLLAGTALSAQQELPRVAVFPFNAPSDDPGIENLSQAATDTLVLTLQLLGKYQIVRGTQPSPLDSEQVFDALRSEFVDYAVYGAIVPNPDGGYSITAYSWDAANNTVTLGVEMDALSAFDLFESMDLATIRFAEEFTGIHIGFGRLVFENRTPAASYIVEIDGNIIGTDVTRREVLYGKRRISIYLPPVNAGDQSYHLVSYILNIEEGEEYPIPFSIDPDIDRSDWNAAQQPPVELGDSLVLASSPRDALIFIGEEQLGRTPLVADPMFIPQGESLWIARDYFIPQEGFAQGPSTLFDLSVDPKSAAVQPALNRVWLGASTNILITATQVMFVLLPGITAGDMGDGPPPWTMLLAASPRFGFLLAGDTKTAAIVSAASMLSFGAILAASELELMDGDLGMALWQIPFWSTVLYDLIASPFAASSANRRTLERIKQEGLPESEVRERPWLGKFYTAAQIGGGAYFMAGFGIDILKEYLAFDLYAGISGDYFEPFKPIPSVNAKALIFPAASFDIPVRPYLAAITHLAVNVEDVHIGGAAGPAVGLEIPVRMSWLQPLTLFLEAEYYFSQVGAFPMIGVGAKLK